MKTITLPGTDLQVSPLCLGLGSIGVRHSESEGHELIDSFLEHGGTFLDTARVYSDWVPKERGRSERVIGDWLASLRSRDPRAADAVVIGTKGAHPLLESMGRPRLSESDIRQDVELSLRALRVERIDLYYLHRDDPSRPIEEIVDVLDALVREGKIRYPACSNWRPERIAAALAYAAKSGKTLFAANQILWNVGSSHMKPPSDPTLVAMDAASSSLHSRTGIPITAYSSQAGGYFTKISSPDSAAREKAERSAYHTEGNRRLSVVLQAAASELGCSNGQLALAYLLNRKPFVVPVIGCHTYAQLADSVGAVDVRIPEKAMARIRAAAAQEW